jgi:multidrug efflux pump
VAKIIRGSSVALLVYAGLIAMTLHGFQHHADRFRADPGQEVPGDLRAIAGCGEPRSHRIGDPRMSTIAMNEPGFDSAVAFPGLSINGFTNSPNAGIAFIGLRPFDERKDPSLSAGAISASLNAKFGGIQDAYIAVFPPPPVQGLGTIGGFRLQIEDRGNLGYDELYKETMNIITKSRSVPELANLFTSYTVNVPQVEAAIDREKAKTHGVAINDIFDTLQVYLGSLYANDFNRFGRTYQVNVQAEQQFRQEPEQIGQLKVRNDHGEMIPLATFVKVSPTSGPDRVSHYNGFITAEINGSAAPGYSSGQAQAAIEKLLKEELPNGMTYEWTDLTYQQILSGNTALLVFPLCVLLAFLVLAALYESWSLPLAVILIVPMTLLSAIAGVIMLQGRQQHLHPDRPDRTGGPGVQERDPDRRVRQGQTGPGPVAAGRRTRSLPHASAADPDDVVRFHHGCNPAGDVHRCRSEMRRAMGVAVFSGMLGVTFFGLLLTPVFFVLIAATSNASKRENKPKP